MTLTGILKNILLVIISVLIWHTAVSWLQFLGYSIALAGLVYYSLGWDQMVAIAQGVWLYARGLADAVRGPASSSSSGSAGEDAGRLPSAVRRALVLGLAAVTVFLLVGGGFYYGGGASVVGEQFGGAGTS